MKFRPCIDIHNGQVKQIVGGSLTDKNNFATENFVSTQDAGFYAELYKNSGLFGGHIIMLNPILSEFYEKNCEQALLALKKFPNGLQVGGGITDENASFFIENGASHVIVTSFVFNDGKVDFDNLEKVKNKVGRENLVLDLSCRRKGEDYFIVTDRWQKFTDVKVDSFTLNLLAEHCDEFLIHAVDVEGSASGIDERLLKILSSHEKNPITYAGGVGSFKDLNLLNRLGNGKIDVTIGSALDLFGGKMEFEKVIEICK